MANILPEKKRKSDIFEFYRQGILVEIQNILIDVILYSDQVSSAMDLSHLESMLTSTLEAYSIYSKLSSAYKWKKIDLCLRRQESGNIYSNRKEFYSSLS